MAPSPSPSIYDAVIEDLFSKSRHRGLRFDRSEINETARAVAGTQIANPGDLVYAYRYRRPFPHSVLREAPIMHDGRQAQWALRLRGRIGGTTTYEFGPVRQHYFEPSRSWSGRIPELPGSVSAIVSDAAAVLKRSGKLNDDQAMLARVRSANLIGHVLGIGNAVAFESGKRTAHPDFGQIEIDEIYVGADAQTGAKYVVPVQAKTGNDKLSVVQVEQDWKWCRQHFGSVGWQVVPLGIRPLGDPTTSGQLEVAVFRFRLEVSAPAAIGPHGDFHAEELRYALA